MRPEDGTRRGGWQTTTPPSGIFSFISSSGLSPGLGLNIATIEPQETFLYAFLDSVEWEAARAGAEGPLNVGGSLEGSGLGQVPVYDLGGPGVDEAPSSTDYGDEEPDNSDLEETEEPPQRFVTARLDCVSTEYFNANFGGFAGFYAKYHEVGLEDPHDLSRPVEHGNDQIDEHAKLINSFHGDGSWFRIIYVTFLATPENMTAFENMFDGEGWAGLGVLTTKDGLGLPVAVYPHDADESEPPPEVWTLRSLYTLTVARRNSLRRIFSLDFAPDAELPEEGGPVPVEPPKTPVIEESRWRQKLGWSSKSRKGTLHDKGMSVRISMKTRRTKGLYIPRAVDNVELLLLVKRTTHFPRHQQEALLEVLFSGLEQQKSLRGERGRRKRLPRLIK
jgi:hypothetical protein